MPGLFFHGFFAIREMRIRIKNINDWVQNYHVWRRTPSRKIYQSSGTPLSLRKNFRSGCINLCGDRANDAEALVRGKQDADLSTYPSLSVSSKRKAADWPDQNRSSAMLYHSGSPENAL
jgi:hypothetical protein